MKYIGMPLGMWLLYRKSFREHLVSVLGCTAREAKEIFCTRSVLSPRRIFRRSWYTSWMLSISFRSMEVTPVNFAEVMAAFSAERVSRRLLS